MITIEREDARPDRLRKYRVILDDREIGQIADGEKKSFEASEGAHELMLRIDWASSRRIQFISTSKPVSFKCRSNITGLKFFLAVPYTTFMRDRYIALWKEATS